MGREERTTGDAEWGEGGGKARDEKKEGQKTENVRREGLDLGCWGIDATCSM